MPGVRVTTSVRSGPATALRALSGQFFVVGQFERGDTSQPVRVRSLGELEALFGSRTPYSTAYDQLVTFFNEGGLQAYVVRVVGAAAAAGTLTVDDRAATPADTLGFTAASVGAWSANLTVEVKDGPTPATYRVIVRLNGNVVEDYNNLATPADAVSKFSTSPYVRVTNLGSATAAPNNIPAVIAPTALSAGNDDRAAVVAANYTDALDLFDEDLGDGAVSVPGQYGDTAYNAIIEHAEANNRIAILAAGQNETAANLRTTAAALDSEYAGLFAPWVVIPDGSGGVRSVSPEGYVAAARTRAHESVGPWRTPAGKIASAAFIVDTDRIFTRTESEDLDAGKVSVIRKIGTSVRLYGWRSLSKDAENWKSLKDRDLVNRIQVEANRRLEDFVFDVVDPRGKLTTALEAALVGFVDPIARADGLWARYDEDGNQIDPGYVVYTGTDINNAASVARNEVNAVLSVRVSPSGDLINLAIVKVGLLNAF